MEDRLLASRVALTLSFVVLAGGQAGSTRPTLYEVMNKKRVATDPSSCSCGSRRRPPGSRAVPGLWLAAALLVAACGGDRAASEPIGSSAGNGGVAAGVAGSAQAGASTGGSGVAGQMSGVGAGAPSGAGQGGNGASGGSTDAGGSGGGSVGGTSGTGGSATAGAGGLSGGAGIDYPKKADVIEVLARVNQQFTKKWPDPGKMLDASHPSNIWTRAVYYEGLLGLNEVSPQAEYKKYAVDWGSAHDWGLRAPVTNADNQCAGQTYYDLYELDGGTDAVRLNAIRDSVDSMVTSASSTNWTWIDAIQMSMPVFIRFGVLTNQDKYYDKAYSLYRYSKVTEGGGLYDPAAHLWWRDAKWKPDQKKTPSGKNIYWSRGNGWVFAALARVLDALPDSQTNRAEYEQDFKDMADALRSVQRADGLWNPSLGDPDHYGGPEMSGTSLFTYGMAWGVRTGLLDEETFGPVVVKAWNGLVKTSVHDDGFLGYAQSTGDAPDDGQPLSYDKVPDFEDFGVGCFLLGGSEVAKLGR